MGADRLSRAHRQWVEQGLENGRGCRDESWSGSIAVGSLPIVEKIKSELGAKAGIASLSY